MFKIDVNNNILATVHISLSTAILGGQVEYRTINGIEKLNVAGKIQDGDVIRFEKQVKHLFYFIKSYIFSFGINGRVIFFSI